MIASFPHVGSRFQFYICSALHFAAMIPGNTDVLELLLSHGADINASNSENSTPLFFSCQSNNTFAASVLIASGADIHLKNNKGTGQIQRIYLHFSLP